LGEEYKSLSFSLFSFLHPPVTLSLLGRNILLNTLFSDTLSLCSTLSVSNLSHLHKTVGKIIVLCITGLYNLHKPQITQIISYSPANVLCPETLIFKFQGWMNSQRCVLTVLWYSSELDEGRGSRVMAEQRVLLTCKSVVWYTVLSGIFKCRCNVSFLWHCWCCICHDSYCKV
jgi:hypothetical protein